MSASAKPSTRFASHAVSYAVGNVARRVVGLLMLPIYTRYLTPADYGAVGLMTFALALLEPLFGARLAQAVPKFYFEASDERSRSAVIWSSLLVTGTVSGVTTLALVLLRQPASHLLFGTSAYALATGLFAVNMLGQPIEYTGMLYIRMQERSGLFLALSMAKLVVQVALTFLLVVSFRLSVVGVVLSGVISSIAIGAVLTFYIGTCARPAVDSATIRKMLRFSWPLWFAGLAGLYISSSGGMYLRVFDSLSDVGLLELALRFATVVGLVVWAPFFQHWEPVSYKYYNERVGADKFQVALVAISTLMFVVGLGISIFAEPVIRIMAATSFHGAARFVPILTLGLILNSLVSLFYFGFFVTERTKMFSYCLYITAAVMTVMYLALIPQYGIEGAVIGQTLAFAANFTYAYYWSRRYYDPGFDLGPTCYLMVVAAVGYVCANLLISPGVLVVDLAFKSAVFILASILMAFVGIRGVKKASPMTYSAAMTSMRRFYMRPLAR